MMQTWGTIGRGLSSIDRRTIGHFRWVVLLASAGAMLLATSTAVAAPPPNHEVTIGANLKTAPNVSFDCTVLPYVIPETINTPSCMWGNPVVPGSAEGGLDVPGTGTIYKVRLRVGSSTGRMRLVILRYLFFDPNYPQDNQCCVLVARSSTFTPVPNRITTLNVKLPVKLGPLGDIDVLDTLGLQVMEDHVAIPLINETSLAPAKRPVDTYNTSALTLGGKQLAGNPAGYRLDMQAFWYPPGQHP